MEATSVPWVILTTRYGGDVESPSPDDLSRAIAELYDARDDEEHDEVSLRRAQDEGPMVVLALFRSGAAELEEWEDADFETPLAPARTIRGVTREAALALCLRLAWGAVDDVRRGFAAGSS